MQCTLYIGVITMTTASNIVFTVCLYFISIFFFSFFWCSSCDFAHWNFVHVKCAMRISIAISVDSLEWIQWWHVDGFFFSFFFLSFFCCCRNGGEIIWKQKKKKKNKISWFGFKQMRKFLSFFCYSHSLHSSQIKNHFRIKYKVNGMNTFQCETQQTLNVG